MKYFFKSAQYLATLLVAVMLFVGQTPLKASDDDVIKVVYPLYFPDVKRVHFMLNTLNNLVKHYQENLIDYEIHVVAYGPGLQYLMKSDKGSGFVLKPYIYNGGPAGNGTAGRLASLKQLAGDNIIFSVCKNTMKKKSVTDDMLVDYAVTTPAGVIKVIDLQREGAALVKIQ